MSLRWSALVVSLNVFVASTRATPLDLTIDSSLSTVNVQMCILSGCDSDPSTVSGNIVAKVTPLTGPTGLTIYDFTFILNDQIDLFISFGIFGQFTGTGQNIVLYYATPGVPHPETPVSSGTFAATGVPTNGDGTFTYTSTGIVCSAIMNAGRPCNDTINLADQGTQSGDLAGTVTVSPARVATITLNPNISIPLDPNNPGLGTLTVTGTIVARATAPLRGDANLDGVVDGRDVGDFLRVLLDPASATWQRRFAADMNDDDAFDPSDADALAACLLDAGCPE